MPSGASSSSERLQAGGRRARVEDEVAAAVGVVGQAKSDAERGALPRRAAGSTSTSVTDAGDPREQPGDAAAEVAGADHRHPVAEQRRGVPQRVDRGLDDPGEHGAGDRHVVGHDGDRGGRDDVRRLVRVQAEDGAAEQLGGPSSTTPTLR